MSGLFGPTGGGRTLVTFDLSVLAGYYQAKAELRSANSQVEYLLREALEKRGIGASAARKSRKP